MSTIRENVHEIIAQHNAISMTSDDLLLAIEKFQAEPNSQEKKEFIIASLKQIRNSAFKANDLLSKIKFPTYMLVDPDVSLDQLEDRIKVKFKELTIHIVEDDMVQCHWLESILKKKGFKVSSSNVMVDAMNHIDQEIPHIVILDLHVPAVKGGTEISMGFDLLEAIEK